MTAALAERGHTVRAASRSTGTDIADPTTLPPLDVHAVVCRAVNVVSPGWVSETLQATGCAGGTPAADVAARYVQAVEDRTLLGATLA